MITRRTTLLGASLLPAAAVAQTLAPQDSGPIRIGVLVPLTGAGGPYGPAEATVAKSVADEVNGHGGVLGRPVEIVVEDDATNPEAGVRAARKLIDVDKVVAICGTWASAVTTAVAPLCWESHTMLLTVSGADSITLLPHNGYIVRTQPNTVLQGRKFGEFLLQLGSKRVFMMSPQTPFTQSEFDTVKAALAKGGGGAELLVYDDKKPSLRTEVDAALRFKPDAVLAGGYLPDTTVLLRDLARASFDGKVLGFGYAINGKLVDALPKEVVEGVYALSPSPSEGSPAYARVQAITKTQSPDPYSCQVYDHVTLAMLAMEAAKQASGAAIRDTIRSVSQGGGTAVTSYAEGVRALGAGEKIDYDGASGPCDFTDIGDISDVKFRYEQVRDGKITLLKIA